MSADHRPTSPGFVIVTRYAGPDGKIIVHAYGGPDGLFPTRSKARTWHERSLRELRRDARFDEACLEFHVARVLAL